MFKKFCKKFEKTDILSIIELVEDKNSAIVITRKVTIPPIYHREENLDAKIL